VNKPKFIESNLITERGYGIFEGLAEEEIKISFPDIYEKWKSNENTEISNAETIDNVVVRIKNFINFLINTNYKNVIAVTHSGFLFTLYKFINDIDLGTRPTEIYFNNYSNNILQVTYDNKEIILLLIANNGIKYKKKFDKF
jgi:broad specificity phosphatase PhoE